MLDQYIQGLVVEANARNKLDAHLEGLAKQAAAEAEMEAFLERATAAELAKMAGVVLPASTCPQCASEMQKLGSVYHCACGMMKRAKELPPELAENAAKTQSVQDPDKPGAEVPAKPASEEKPEKESKCKTASIANFAEAVIVADGNVKLAFDVLAQAGFEELGFTQEDIEKNAFLGKAFQGLGAGLKGAWGTLRAGAKAGGGLGAAAREAGGAMKTFGKDVGSGVANVARQVPAKAKEVQQTYQGARAGQPGLFGTSLMATPGKGVGGALMETARAHPGVAMGLTGAGAGAAGFGLGKLSSARELVEVGDAAGRLMAKTALELDPAEVGEAIEAAKEREDIPGRARRWGAAGAGIGGLGAGALGALGGMGVSKMLGGKGRIAAPLIGAALGGTGGGVLGHRIGTEEGAEEAAADRLVSMLRGRRAYMAGGQQGYAQGLQRGFNVGRGVPGRPQ